MLALMFTLCIHSNSLFFFSAELVEKKERRAHPTAFMQAKMDYKEMRVKIAPVVGAKKAGVCAVM